MGHSVKLSFSISDPKDDYGAAQNVTSKDIEVLAVPTYDGHLITCMDDLYDQIATMNDTPLTLMNDFDVPWVQQSRVRFPKIPKKKVVREIDDD